MRYPMPRDLLLPSLLLVSLFGLIVTITFALHPPAEVGDFPLRKPLVGSIFLVICFLGLLAVVYPGRCSRMIGIGKREQNASDASCKSGDLGKEEITYNGHHPSCDSYSSHVFQVDGKVLCVGCTGLFLGGIAAFVGALLYFFTELHPWQDDLLPVWIGTAGLVLGLLPLSLRVIPWRPFRAFSSAFFAFGAFLVLAGVDRAAQSVSLDLYLIALIIFWILTRIRISQWDHERICRFCNLDGCKLRRPLKGESISPSDVTGRGRLQ